MGGGCAQEGGFGLDQPAGPAGGRWANGGALGKPTRACPERVDYGSECARLGCSSLDLSCSSLFERVR
jgi:hypothetical protein